MLEIVSKSVPGLTFSQSILNSPWKWKRVLLNMISTVPGRNSFRALSHQHGHSDRKAVLNNTFDLVERWLRSNSFWNRNRDLRQFHESLQTWASSSFWPNVFSKNCVTIFTSRGSVAAELRSWEPGLPSWPRHDLALSLSLLICKAGRSPSPALSGDKTTGHVLRSLIRCLAVSGYLGNTCYVRV